MVNYYLLSSLRFLLKKPALSFSLSRKLSPWILKDLNSLEATVDLQEPSLKKAYVILPGHPFCGQQVNVLQSGCTKTIKWFLIEHPVAPHFHYRLSSRWLAEWPPSPLESSLSPSFLSLSAQSLNKLACYLKCLEGSAHDFNPLASSEALKGEKKHVAPLSQASQDLAEDACVTKDKINSLTDAPVSPCIIGENKKC